jgi:hypothetical protein
MRRIIPIILVFALIVPLILSGCGKTAEINRLLVGRWVSPEREYTTNPDGSVYYIVRDLTFSTDAFRLVTTVYGDPVSDIKFYTATVDGNYELVGASKTIQGAVDIDFTFSQITMTPNSLAFVDIFMRSGCGNGMWGIDSPQDVSKTGCLSFRSTDTYPKEYDIVKIEGNSLYLGVRPKDGDIGAPEKRPNELSVAGLTKQVP